MLYIIYYCIGLVVAASILFGVSGAEQVSPDVFWVGSIVFTIVFVIWGCVMITNIKDYIAVHIDNFYLLDTFAAKKKSYEAEMEAYKADMQEELLNKYREFESALMESVKDSKLLATVLQQSGYASILDSYNDKIKAYLHEINKCDREYADTMRKLLAKRDNNISGYGTFIPKKFKWLEEVKKS